MVRSLIKQSPPGIETYLNHPWNLIKTGFLVITWTILGFHLELIDTTMPKLTENIHVNYSAMGSVLASRGFGYLVANILGVILQKVVKNHSDGLLVLAFIAAAIVAFVAPFVTSLIVMYILFFIQGLSQGITILAGINIVLTMWGTHAAAPLNAVQFGYPLGAFSVICLVRPFLNEKTSLTNLAGNEDFNSTSASRHMTWVHTDIMIPYSITALLCLLIAIGHIYFYIRWLRDQREKLEIRQVNYGTLCTDSESVSYLEDEEASSPYSSRTFGGKYYPYNLVLVIIFIPYMFFASGIHQAFPKFYFTYLKSEQFHISNNGAIWSTALYWLSFCIGRLLGVVLSIFLSVNVCLDVVWFGSLCVAIAWLIFTWSIGLSGTSLLILGAATGLVFASVFPLSFGFVNQQIHVTPMLLASILCGSSLGIITLQIVAGVIIDWNPNYFPILLVVSILMSTVLYIASNVVYSIREHKKFVEIQPPITNGEALSPEKSNEEEQTMTNDVKDEEDK